MERNRKFSTGESNSGEAAKSEQSEAKRTRAETKDDRKREEEVRKRARDRMWRAWSSSGKTGEDAAKENKGDGSGAKDGAEKPD